MALHVRFADSNVTGGGLAGVAADNVTYDAIHAYDVGGGGNVAYENATTSTMASADEAELVEMPEYLQALIIVMYSSITVLAVGGNVIVCYIVLAYQRMRTVTNFFIFNLALSDILMAVLCVPFTFVANVLMLYWPFPAIMCPIVTYVQTLSVFLSAFTLVAISLDRCRAILFPLRPRMTKRCAALVILVIWILSLSVALPILVVSRCLPMDNEPNLTYCAEDWDSDNQRYIYTLVIMVLQYFLPLFVLIVTYSSIAINIWSKRAPGEAENNRDQRMAASRRKMVKMMITVVIIYAICWLPLHTITLIGDAHQSIYNYPYIQVVWTACHWVAMSNCCYNPLVYCWMNGKFRSGFVYVLRFCPCVKYSADEHSPPRFPRRNNTYITTLRSNVGDSRHSKYDGGGAPSPYAGRQLSHIKPAYSSTSTTSTTVNSCCSGEKVPLESITNGFSNGRKCHTAAARSSYGGRGHHIGEPLCEDEQSHCMNSSGDFSA